MNRLFTILLAALTLGLAATGLAQQAQPAKKKPGASPARQALFIGLGSASWLPDSKLLPSAADIEARAGKLSSRLRNQDAFGLSTFPREDDAPVVEEDIYRETPRITLNQALQTLKVNGVNLHRKEFLIGGRTAAEGDVLELVFKGETFQAQVLEISASQVVFRDLQREETGILQHNVIPQLSIQPLQKVASQFESRMTPLEPAPTPAKP